MHRRAGVLAQHVVAEEAVIGAPAAARRALLALAVPALDDDGHRHAHQRPHVGGQPAVAAGDENDFVLAGQMRHDLRHARVLGAGEGFEPFEQAHLGRGVERGQRIVRQVQRVPRLALLERAGAHAPLLPGRGDGAHRRGGVGQRR